MKLLLLLFVIIIFSLFGAIQGLRTKERNLVAAGETTESKKLNRLWHKIQAGLHGLIAFAVSFHFGFSFLAGIAFVLTLTIIWTVFDLTHNLTAGQDWYYAEDKEKSINGWLKKRIGERGILLVKGGLLIILTFLYLWN